MTGGEVRRFEAMKVLSVRQPWAWLIVNGHKDIENREWETNLRGRVWIHTGVHQVTKAEYAEFMEKCRMQRIRNYPEPDGFQDRRHYWKR